MTNPVNFDPEKERMFFEKTKLDVLIRVPKSLEVIVSPDENRTGLRVHECTDIVYENNERHINEMTLGKTNKLQDIFHSFKCMSD